MNISVRGTDALRVLGPNTVAYLDRTGSGNETAAHLRVDGRLTVMFCAFEGPPMILRLYGRGRILRRAIPDYANLIVSEFEGLEPVGARQIVMLDVDLVQTSCGFGVPLFDYTGERTIMTRWAEAKGEQGWSHIGARRTRAASTACRQGSTRRTSRSSEAPGSRAHQRRRNCGRAPGRGAMEARSSLCRNTRRPFSRS